MSKKYSIELKLKIINEYLTGNEEIRSILEYIDYKLKIRKRDDVRRNIQMIKYIIEFQVLYDMRISELLAIEPSNIDFKKKTTHYR